ncbi:MAG: hypothetical protein WCJ33_06725 [Pseudomonadota bacterium]
MNFEERNLYKLYDEMFPEERNNNIDEDECKHINTTLDKSEHYIVCIQCGQCIDTTNVYIPEFNYLACCRIKRCYKKTNYLKIKMKAIIQYINSYEENNIRNEFIKYDKLYRQHNKKLKYDFILKMILLEMQKGDLIHHLKVFKSKLEKKRLKEFNFIKNN